MGSVKVTVFGRIKPCEKQRQEYRLNYGDQEDEITFTCPKAPGKKNFRFSKIFNENTTQEQVFEAVAKPVINSVFSGYNGTIFTYGQTGSGKTYTMTGDLGNWFNTGLIPRTVQEIFKMKKQDTVISITYSEIYNEHIYDLIRVDRMDSDLTQVSLLDVNTGVTHIRNLSVHIVTTAYEALQLLIKGDANKMVAETGSNVRSSRSHVIFSITLELPHPSQENLCLKPVLYLVDLAGSEKLSNCKTPMSNLSETRYINLSLHYLEQVLIALRQPGRVHIPYRNSLMTALLRNSLGGNCITTMVATFSTALEDAEETLQTCRFAERIALIKNEVKLSESLSPEKEIDLLKKENERLKAQLKLISNDQVTSKLSDEDKEKCSAVVQKFIKDNNYFELPLTSIRRMEYCFQLMREEILKKKCFKEYEKRKKENIQDLHKPSEDNNMPLQLNPRQSALMSSKHNIKRKRHPLNIPKVNITYKKWKSTERLSEKENDVPNVVNELEIEFTDLKLTESANAELKTLDSKSVIKSVQQKNSLLENRMKSTLQLGENFFREKIFGKQGSSNVDLKFSGETKNENKYFLNANTSNVSIKPDFPSRTDSETIQILANGGVFKLKSKTFDSSGIMIKEITDYEKKSQDNDERLLDQVSLNSNDSNEFPARCMPFTGDKEVDEEIFKFYKSRYQIFRNK